MFMVIENRISKMMLLVGKPTRLGGFADHILGTSFSPTIGHRVPELPSHKAVTIWETCCGVPHGWETPI